MRVLDSYQEDVESLEELNEYRGGNRKATKEARHKVLNKLGKKSDEHQKERHDSNSLKN